MLIVCIQRQWLGDPAAPPAINDTLFISELLTHLEARFCIDTTKIFAAGKSNGGGMVGQLACNPEMSSRVASFAAAPGAFYQGYDVPCNPSRTNVPILELHGGADTRILYQGGPDPNRPGYSTDPIPTWLQSWATRNQCHPVNTTVPLTGVVGDNEVTKTTWNCGETNGLVSHYFSKTMKHVWPTVGNAGYNGTQVIMEFFGLRSS